MRRHEFDKNLQYAKFCAYGFLKDLRFYEPFLMLFFLEKGLSYIQIGALYAVREIVVNIVEIPSGILADALGRRKTMAVSFVAYIASLIVFYHSREYMSLLFAMVAYAFGDAFRTGTHKAMIFDYLKSRNWAHLKTHYYGHTRSWSQRGAAVSALIAAALVFRHGSYAPVFLFTIVPYVLDLLLIMSYPKELDGPRHSSTKSVRDEFRAVFQSLVSSMKSPEALRAISNQALYTGYYKACKDYLQPILKATAVGLPVLIALQTQERTAIIVGVVYSALYLLTSAAARRSGRVADAFGSLVKPLNSTLMIGLAFGALSGIAYVAGVPLVAILLYIGIYVTENVRKPMGIAYVSERMQQESLASALSVESQVETVFAAAIAIVLGLLSTAFGLGAGIILVSLACACIGYLIRLPRDGRDAPASQNAMPSAPAQMATTDGNRLTRPRRVHRSAVSGRPKP